MACENILPQKNGVRIKASPLAKKTAARLGIDISEILGQGPNGRIIQKDVFAAADKKAAAKSAVFDALADTEAMLMPDDVICEMNEKRRGIAEKMTVAHSIPAITQNVKIDVTALLDFKRRINEGRKSKITINDIILKAVAATLRQNPRLLQSVNGKSIIQRAHINIAMPVAVEDGPIIPVIADADKLTLEGISIRAKTLAQRARKGALSTKECENATFAVSNVGMLGVESFTPIILEPNSAILGVNCIENELILEDSGAVLRREVMRVSLTFDCRIISGAVAAKFGTDLRELLEDPIQMLM